MKGIPETGSNRKIASLVFRILCVVPFILIPLLSLDAGISGDEPVHYAHAEKVYNYFATSGRDTSALHTPETFLRYYGQFADDLSFRINRLLKADEPYLIRHLMNSLSGAAIILLAGLLGRFFAGPAAGILVILFLLLSPPFLGHSYNNLKDIPFTLGYTASIYFLIRLMAGLPKIRILPVAGMAIASAFALSVRAGGLLLFPIFIAFILYQGWTVQAASGKDRYKFWLRLAGVVVFVIVAGWALGILNWPYALQDPVGHPLKALVRMTHYNVSLRQLFDGKLIWSEAIPWYYVPKYFLITTPAVILAGLAIYPFSLKIRIRDPESPKILLVLFAALFPIFWIIINRSNLYGGIRHLLFVYPFLTLMGALGWIYLSRRISNKLWKLIPVLILAAGSAGPLIHIIRNHPVEYVYFNKLSGGLDKAWGRYETDYYYHSLGPAIRWFQKEIIDANPDRKTVVASNFPLEPFFLNRESPLTVYTPYDQKGEHQWDYGIFAVAYFSPSQVRDDHWPPAGTIHTVKVDGHPVCAIVGRATHLDHEGYLAFNNKEYGRAIELLEGALRADPFNETAWLYLGWSYRNSGNLKASSEAAKRLIDIHPESETPRELLIWNCLDTGEFGEALRLADELTGMNPKYPPALRLRGAVLDSLRRVSPGESR